MDSGDFHLHFVPHFLSGCSYKQPHPCKKFLAWFFNLQSLIFSSKSFLTLSSLLTNYGFWLSLEHCCTCTDQQK